MAIHSFGISRLLLLLTASSLALALKPGHAANSTYNDGPQFSTRQIAPLASALNASMATAGGNLETHGIASYLNSTQDLLRLESTWTRELTDTARVVRIGDTVSNPGTWGSAVRFAGVQYGTHFNLRSDLLNANRLPLAGVAIVPSTLSAVLTAGKTTSPNAPRLAAASIKAPVITAATNNLSITARDALGKTTTLKGPLLAKQETAQIGCKNFSVAVGRARQDYALVSNRYGPLFANSTMVCGMDSGVAIEAHGEYLQGDTSIAGLSVLHPISNAGLGKVLGKGLRGLGDGKSSASVAVAASDHDKGTGWLVRAGLQHSNPIFDINLRALLQSQEYRELGAAAATDVVAQRVVASVGAKMSANSTLAIAYANQTTFALQRTDIMAMTQTFDLGRKGMFSIAANRANDDAKSSLNLSYSRALY